ncbi:hypothetical protein [Desulfovibrio sp. ZJ200]|uniref:hypothetical protein n=1 Tax=Desulfovibrio sp. ZJ200 TaxID=2709792 RepID=UPI0013EA0B13|nr:hypothetical protein [Desulfovibrio sp. ZJ200]
MRQQPLAKFYGLLTLTATLRGVQPLLVKLPVREITPVTLEHFHFKNALLTRKWQPPQRGVYSGKNRVFRLNATFDFYKKSKVICSRAVCC